MSIPRRNADQWKIASDERTFFITSSTDGRKALLQSDRSAKLFLEVLYGYRSQRKFLLHEFVIMPNHFHLLLTASELTIERAVQLIKGGFAFRAGKEFGLRAPVWQKGFSDARIMNSAAYRARQRYIYENPVSRGLVQKAQDFPYSSAFCGFELDAAPSYLRG